MTKEDTLHLGAPRTIYQVKKFGINQILIPPSEEFLDRCAAIQDLALSREDEDDNFGQFGDEQVGPTLSLGKLKSRWR